jgi:hypothetical protein
MHRDPSLSKTKVYILTYFLKNLSFFDIFLELNPLLLPILVL